MLTKEQDSCGPCQGLGSTYANVSGGLGENTASTNRGSSEGHLLSDNKVGIPTNPEFFQLQPLTFLRLLILSTTVGRLPEPPRKKGTAWQNSHGLTPPFREILLILDQHPAPDTRTLSGVDPMPQSQNQ